MSLQKFFDSFDNVTYPIFREDDPKKCIIFQWSLTGIGFGSLYFYEENNKLICDSEHLDRDSVKQILNNLVDKSILYDETKQGKQVQKDWKKRQRQSKHKRKKNGTLIKNYSSKSNKYIAQ
jgi:hypothetical protein